MKKQIILASAIALSIGYFNTSQAQTQKIATSSSLKTSKQVVKSTPSISADGFQMLNGGLEYKVITKGRGLVAPKVGDFGEISVINTLEDSTLFNTNDMNDGKPVPNPFQNPHYAGDLNEGLLLMRAGDSTIFRIEVDTLFAHIKQQKPAFMNGKKYLYWYVKMHKIETKEEHELKLAAQQQQQVKIDDSLIKDYIHKNKLNAKRTASGLYYVVTKAGTGASPAKGNKVTVNYTGMLLNGTKFDSNVDSNFHHVQPFTFNLGNGNVIKGWDEGVALMNKGEKATFIIPSHLAYGQRSPDPSLIPENSVMVFDIELVSFEN